MIKNNDLITHRVHRHEPPVVGTDIDIIHNDDELVVVNKPASIPVSKVLFVMYRTQKLSVSYIQSHLHY